MIRARQFFVYGIFWRRFLRWAAMNVPAWADSIVIAFWAGFFLLFWGAGRRGLMYNMRAIMPGTRLGSLLRAYRVFWNYSWTLADNLRFKELRVAPDWEFSGLENFERLDAESGGAIILTAHMGSYDLGAPLFAEISRRQIMMVRAPERDPETRDYEEALHNRTIGEKVKVGFNTTSSDLAIDLLHALGRGEFIAIQGDRATAGISTLPATLFGRTAAIPAGPFALAMAAAVPIYPLFIMRLGRRRYRLVVGEPFHVPRSRNRAEVFEKAVARWIEHLETVIRTGWYQWYAFAPFSEEPGR